MLPLAAEIWTEKEMAERAQNRQKGLYCDPFTKIQNIDER